MSSTPPVRFKTVHPNAWVLFVVFAFAMCFDRILLGPFAPTIFPDSLDNMLSFSARARLICHSGFTAWNPMMIGGLPTSASPFATYSLPILLSTVVPLWVTVHLWNILVIVAFGYGTFRVAVEFFGVSRQSAVLAAVFSLAPILHTNTQHLFTFVFPLFFAWTHDLCKDGLSLRKRVVLLAGLLCIAATSYPVLTIPLYPVFHLFFYLVFGRKQDHFGRNIAAVFLIWTGYVLFNAPLIVSLFNYLPFSQRLLPTVSPGLATAALTYFQEMRSVLRMDNILVPALLASFFAPRVPVVRRCLLFAVVPFFIGLLFQPTFKVFLADTILTKMDLSMALLMLPFPLTLCLGMILDRLRKDFSSLPWYWWLLTLALAVLVLKSEDRIVRNVLLMVEVSLAAVLIDRGGTRTTSRTGLLVAVLCGCVALSIMLSRQSAVVAGQARVAQVVDNHPQLRTLANGGGQAPFRVGSLDLHPAIAMQYGLEMVDGRGSVFNRYFKDNMRLVVSPQFQTPGAKDFFESCWYVLTLAPTPASNPRYDQTFGVPHHTADDLDFSALQSLNVRYILAGHPVSGMEKYATLAFVDPGKGLPGPLHSTALNRSYELPVFAYRLNETLERGRIVSHTLSFPDRKQVLQTLAGMNLEARRSTAVFLDAERQGLPELAGAGGGTARLLAYSPDSLVYDCEVRGPSCLVVANNFDPGWQATVDGTPAKILRADNAFQAVFLDRAGRHRVELAFRPPLLGASYAAAFVGLVMFCSLLLLSRRAALGDSPAASPVQDGTTGMAIPSGCWLASLVGGGLAAALWAAGFALLQLPRFPYPHEPVHYALVVIPVAGVLVALAMCSALRLR